MNYELIVLKSRRIWGKESLTTLPFWAEVVWCYVKLYGLIHLKWVPTTKHVCWLMNDFTRRFPTCFVGRLRGPFKFRNIAILFHINGLSVNFHLWISQNSLSTNRELRDNGSMDVSGSGSIPMGFMGTWIIVGGGVKSHHVVWSPISQWKRGIRVLLGAGTCQRESRRLINIYNLHASLSERNQLLKEDGKEAPNMLWYRKMSEPEGAELATWLNSKVSKVFDSALLKSKCPLSPRTRCRSRCVCRMPTSRKPATMFFSQRLSPKPRAPSQAPEVGSRIHCWFAVCSKPPRQHDWGADLPRTRRWLSKVEKTQAWSVSPRRRWWTQGWGDRGCPRPCRAGAPKSAPCSHPWFPGHAFPIGAGARFTFLHHLKWFKKAKLSQQQESKTTWSTQKVANMQEILWITAGDNPCNEKLACYFFKRTPTNSISAKHDAIEERCHAWDVLPQLNAVAMRLFTGWYVLTQVPSTKERTGSCFVNDKEHTPSHILGRSSVYSWYLSWKKGEFSLLKHNMGTKLIRAWKKNRENGKHHFETTTHT